MTKAQRKGSLIRWFFVTASLVMIGVGLLNGEASTVLGKAINICLECIGIG